MPFHLRPLTRRQFLSRSTAAIAGAALAPSLSSLAADGGQESIALLSDPHIAAERNLASRGVKMADHLESVVRNILGSAERPDTAILSGDCAYSSGEVADYGTFSELIKPLRAGGTTVHLALGNHDNRENFWSALAEEKAAAHPVPDRQTALVRTRLVNWFILDSLEKTLSTPGFVGKDQLDWLAKALDANADRPAVLVVHHNPGKLANVDGVRDSDDLFAILRPRRQVKAWIFGHTHHWGVTQDSSGIHLVNLPPVGYVFRQGDPSGWVQAQVSEKNIRLTMHCVDTSHKEHGKQTTLDFRT